MGSTTHSLYGWVWRYGSDSEEDLM
ncbi:hypothetical protein ACE02D_11780 [Shewanella bicestrii]